MHNPHISPRHPASIHGMHWKDPQRHCYEMTTFDTRCFLARIDARLSRRWLDLESLDLRFTQPIATAMHFAPARRPAARSLRHHPGSLVQYVG